MTSERHDRIERDSEDMTRVGPGTVMGEYFRQFWIPAAMASEMKRDGAPMRLMLLGEKLIAFRDSEGRVGIMDHRCPHRCASLFLGRNEENGIRCVYHGWKFDVAGNCVDMPSVPQSQDFKHKITAKAYRVTERNGLIWVYMGSRVEAPPLPAIEPSLLSEGDMVVNFVLRECNWLQGLEGDIDTSHFGFLHAGEVDVDDFDPDDLQRYTVMSRAPEYHVSDAPWGTTYAAYRPTETGEMYWRFANCMLPFWTQTPQGQFANHVGARAWVPMDDHHTMFVHLGWKKAVPTLSTARKDGTTFLHVTRRHDYLPNSTDWYGRWRLRANPRNDWLIDREAQSTGRIYTGIDNIHLQDQAVTESMGAITDHAFEHLGPSDQMIARTRRRLIQAARALRDKGTLPPGIADPDVFRGARSGYFISGEQRAWQEIYARKLSQSVRPAEALRAAE